MSGLFSSGKNTDQYDQRQEDPGAGYSNYGYWQDYGRTDPAFWNNPQDQGFGGWGAGVDYNALFSQLLKNQNSQQPTSLLDILARVNKSNYGGW